MAYPIKSPKKLIEVALPLDAINAAAAREKSIRHGHPSTLHLWWARRPLAAARAVIFAQLVNDPGYQQGGGFKYGRNKKEAAIERKRLFKIIEELVKWENTTNEEVLEAARAEIRRSWREVCELNKDHPQAAELFDPGNLPALHDPFAGGGTIPLEAQRLGIDTFASDLNPVAVLINKAMLEIASPFIGQSPVGPLPPGDQVCTSNWSGTTGLAEDIRRYGTWMRHEAEKRIGSLYPAVFVTHALAEGRDDLKGLIGKKLTVIAWLWARTVKSPNPAFSHVDVPLASTFVLSTKVGQEAFIEPSIDRDRYRFNVKLGPPNPSSKLGTKAAGRGANFLCILSNTPIDANYIRSEAQAGRLGQRLLAVVAEGPHGRVYLSPSDDMEATARLARPTWQPDVEFFQDALGFRIGNYGMTKWSDLFSARQLVALSTFSELVQEARGLAFQHAVNAGMSTDDDRGIDDGGRGAKAYADAVATYLAFGVSRSSDYWSSLCIWRSDPKNLGVGHVFSRQTLSMIWDFAEGNPLSDSSGNWSLNLDWVCKVVARLGVYIPGSAAQCDARKVQFDHPRIVSTDPPYYDNVGYADLSDFFYVWLRRSLRPIFPRLFATISVPKAEELVATPGRHGGKDAAEKYFLDGMTDVLSRLAGQSTPTAPLTIFYAFKQSDTEDSSGTSSTGWETFLEAVWRAGLQITGTWPMRTELGNRVRGMGSNALASSIVLVCRTRSTDALVVSRREFLRELNLVLPEALDEMTKGSGDDRSPVAPVDLSQAIIGPGMSVFSKYAAVLEANGEPMTVRTALQLINQFLAEDDFEHDTQFCLHWFEQYGWDPGAFGEADVLARAKATSVDGLAEAGVVHSGGGKVRLLKPNEYPADWDPRTDKRMPIWEALHQLIRSLRQRGESGAGEVLGAIKSKSEAIRQLAYRMYTLCERRGFAEDARAYNELVTSWSGIEAVAGQVPEKDEQLTLFGEKK